ncbi:hypothetical protein FACS1894147_13200 [Spirochaetia bacterium]|nr:hypothetical protein FACS1894147_13200 [Spirochaetia bacterium]
MIGSIMMHTTLESKLSYKITNFADLGNNARRNIAAKIPLDIFPAPEYCRDKRD